MSKPPRIDLRALDIGMLRTFDALMRERSVSRAAARLFLSQPAVSGSLAKLRRTFGDPLFKRTPHGVSPTPLALSMADAVADLLLRMGRLLENGHSFDPTGSDRIFRIAGSDYSSRLILAPLMARLHATNASVRIAWEPPQFHTLFERIWQYRFLYRDLNDLLSKNHRLETHPPRRDHRRRLARRRQSDPDLRQKLPQQAPAAGTTSAGASFVDMEGADNGTASLTGTPNASLRAGMALVDAFGSARQSVARVWKQIFGTDILPSEQENPT